LRHIERDRLSGLADSVSANVDREITGLINMGRALATSPSIMTGDLAAFDLEARQVVRGSGQNVLLVDRNFQQLVNTRVAVGAKLPKLAARNAAELALRTGEPQISDIVIGAVSGREVFSIVVPVTIADERKFAIVVGAEPSLINEVLRQQMLPAEWHAAIIDGNGKVFASIDPASQLTPEALALPPGGSSSRAYETDILGSPSAVSQQSSSLTGWTTVAWSPLAVLDAPINQMWNILLAAGVFAGLVAGLAGWLFSLPFANLILQVNLLLGRTGSGQPLPAIKSILSEGDEIFQSLAAADVELLRRQQQNREGKALLDTLMTHVPEGITVVGGPDFRVLANSRKALEWLGKQPEDLLVGADSHAAAFGIWFPDGVTRPRPDQLPLHRASRQGEVIENEHYLVRRPDGGSFLIEVNVNPIRDDKGTIVGAISCWRDVTERQKTAQLIETSEKRLRLALSVAEMAIIDLDLLGGQSANVVNGEALFGIDVNGQNVAEAMRRILALVHPDDRERVEQANGRNLGSPGVFSNEYRIVKKDGALRWIETRGETIADEAGAPVRILGASQDVTKRKAADQHLRLVLREMTHRAKNLLTVILAIATQTGREGRSREEFLDVFAKRIHGLGASHDLLVRTEWAGAPLSELIQSQLAPFDGVDNIRVTASGPPVVLKVDVLQSLGLALHELATNATKHGALSSPTGRVAIKWSIVGKGTVPRLRLSWTESGGPPVMQDVESGFGQIIVGEALEQVVEGKVTIKLDPQGLSWTMDAPLQAVAAPPQGSDKGIDWRGSAPPAFDPIL
jgi:PAS domain S-box-containing protein